MIIVDPRDGGVGKQPGIDQPSDLLVKYIRAEGIECNKAMLSSGDAAFEGYGPQGKMFVGIEIKRMKDLLNCIRDGRLNEQLAKMKDEYGVRIVLVESRFKPRDPDGLLMQCFDGQYFPAKHISSTPQYIEVYNYLMSISLSGVTVTFSRNIWHTAFNICCIFKYFQKKWGSHTSRLKVHDKAIIPAIMGDIGLTRRWAKEIDGVSIKHSMEAERLFKKPILLANSDETQWVQAGLGRATATKIIKQIRGYE